jgi:Ankyrin repeats (3 copies)/Ankyrin repeat
MIESGNNLKASLVIALQVQDLENFTRIIKNTSLDLNRFVDPGGFNIFHDFSKTIVKEYLLMPYLKVLLDEFQVRHPLTIFKEMLDSKTVKDQQTPLHLAAKYNKKVRFTKTIAIEYLKLGANPRLLDNNNQNILHISASQGHVGLFVHFYSELNLNPQEIDKEGNTPLHLSASEGHDSMTIYLISITKDLDKQNSKGYTPLHLSVISCSYKIARHLIMNGASRNVKCHNGTTPMELALSRGSVDLIQVLVFPI